MSYGRKLIFLVFLFLALLSITLAQQIKTNRGQAFEGDDAYLDLVFAESLSTSSTYGSDAEHPLPATRDALWRLLLAGTLKVTGDPAASARILGALFGLVTLAFSLRIARLLSPETGFYFYAGLLLILAPPVVPDALSGSSIALLTALITSATWFHLNAWKTKNSPLPTVSALMLGLAASVRVEMILIWCVYALHALIMCFFRPRHDRGFIYTIVRGITGFLTMAACLAPIIGWNLHVLGVPWPRITDMPTSIDALGNSQAGVLGGMKQLIASAIQPAWARMWTQPFVRGLIEKIGIGLGLIFLCLVACRRREFRSCTLFVSLLLMPIAYAVIYPLTGWSAADAIFRAMVPLWIVVASFGVWKSAEVLSHGMARLPIPEVARKSGVYVILCFLLLVSSIAGNRMLIRHNAHALAAASMARVSMITGLRDAGSSDIIVTDRPGWLLYSTKASVLDLTGEVTPDMLRMLDRQGHLAASPLKAYLASKKPQWFVLWGNHHDFVQDLVPCADRAPESRPQVCHLNWPAGP